MAIRHCRGEWEGYLYRSSLVKWYLRVFDGRVARRHPFIASLARHLADSGMTIDAMLDAAREFDPDGYSREALRSMYNGPRRLRLRAMSAMSVAAGYPADEDEFYCSAVGRYLLDERMHGPEGAAANLRRLRRGDRLDVTVDEIKRIPVHRRADAFRRAAGRPEGDEPRS